MLFVKRGLVCLAIGIFAFLSFASAINVSRTDNSATSLTIDVSSASNLYGYEVAFDYTGTPDTPTFAGFLGSTTSGLSTRNGIAKVYESKTDGTNTGVTGSGELFTLTFSGTVTLRSLLAVYGDGSSEYVYYNNTDDEDGSGGGGGGSSGGGGGGGGGGSSEASSPVTFSTKEINTKAVYQKSANNPIKLTNTGATPITITISATGDLKDHATFLSTITLAPGETKDFIVSVDGNKKGAITGTLVFTSSTGQVLGEVTAEINIASANFLFDSSLAIADRFKHLAEGKKLTFQINLVEVGVQKDKVDVVATYTVKDFGGNSFLEESETISVQGQKEYTKQLATQHLPPGKYVLGLELVYPGAFATSSTQFEIVPKQPVNIFLLIGLGVFVLVIGSAVIFWAYHRRSAIMPKLKTKRNK